MFNFCAAMQPANFSNIKCDIPELKGDNYKVWKERIVLHLVCMDIDYAIRKDKPLLIPTLQLKRLFMNNGSDQITLV